MLISRMCSAVNTSCAVTRMTCVVQRHHYMRELSRTSISILRIEGELFADYQDLFHMSPWYNRRSATIASGLVLILGAVSVFPDVFPEAHDHSYHARLRDVTPGQRLERDARRDM